MTRAEAILHIVNLSAQVDGEFCCGQAESEALERETTDALIALGVDEDEQNAVLS